MSAQDLRIAIDAMGSDLGPEVVVRGVHALTRNPACPKLILVGDTIRLERELRRCMGKSDARNERIEIVGASDAIESFETPSHAIAAKPKASVLVAADLVAQRQADVLVSAGNTGAVTLACAKYFGRIPGIERAALTAVYPTEQLHGEAQDPFSLILDVGLTLEPSPEDLAKFALMGAAYARHMSRNPRPKVGLLSNGAESAKGTASVVAAHALIQKLPNLEFIGNIEGTDIPVGKADVVVTGGFVGNIVLKMLEGISDTMVRTFQVAGERNLRYKAALSALSPLVRRLRRATDWQEYGGVPILGFSQLCIKAHGRSTERAMANAVKVATKAARGRVLEEIGADLKTVLTES